MPEPLKGDQRTATQIQQAGLELPVASRDTGLMQKAADATGNANLLTHQTAEAGKAAGLAVNNLRAEPILDANGNVIGYTAG